MKKEVIFFIIFIGFLFGCVICFLNYQEFFGVLLILMLSSCIILKPPFFLYILIILMPLRLYLMGQSFLENQIFDTAALINIFIPLWTSFYLLLNRKSILFNRVFKFYFIFLLFCFFSVFYAPNLMDALKYFCRLLTPICIYIICLHEIKNKHVSKNILMAIILASIIPLTVGFLQEFHLSKTLSTDNQFLTYGRISGTFGHANPFSFFLLIVFLVSFSIFLTSQSSRERILYGAFGFLVFIYIIFTYCRITWIALLASFLFMSLFLKKRIYIVAAALFLLLIIGLDFFHMSTRIFETAEYFRSKDHLYAGTSIGWRLKAWEAIALEFVRKPFFGYGLRSHFSILNSLYGVDISVHNSYLEILYDVGIFAFLTFLSVLYLLLYNIKQIFKSYKDKLLVPMAGFLHKRYFLIFSTVFLAYLITMLSDNITEYYDISIYFWIIFAIGSKFKEATA